MYTEITSIEEALKRQPEKIDQANLPDLSSLPSRFSRGMWALFNLQAAAYAINNDDPNVPEWKPDYNNASQQKWFPWYIGGNETGSGFRFDVTLYDYVLTYSFGGSRFAMKDRARALHMDKYFREYYKEFALILQ